MLWHREEEASVTTNVPPTGTSGTLAALSLITPVGPDRSRQRHERLPRYEYSRRPAGIRR
jgi:hypothetical protein